MESTKFEMPSATEKQSGKFLIDLIQDRNFKDTQKIPVEFSSESVPNDLVKKEENTQTCFPNEAVSPAPESIPYEPLSLEPEKKYYRIGEASELLCVEPYVLRYWETEFSSVKPIKSKSGQRVYARKDVETLNFIKHLLYTEKFSIKGAKKKVLERKRTNTATHLTPDKEKHSQLLKSLIIDLKDLLHSAKQDFT